MPEEAKDQPSAAGRVVQAKPCSMSDAEFQNAELQHKVRNVLAVVRSVARRTAETSNTVQEYAMNFDGRLNAYSRTLALLAQDPDNGVELEYLVAEELLAVQAHDGDQVNISGPSMRFRPRAAESLGLAIHELATNAIKHGALGVADGKVDVSWKLENNASGKALVFDWIETSGRRLMPAPTHRPTCATG